MNWGAAVCRPSLRSRQLLNEETERLLSIAAQHPGAPVVRDPAAFEAAQRELFARG
jgi:hypothetical protein